MPTSGVAPATACAITGLLCHPVLVMVGFDPGSAAGGFVGCLMAQTLLPKSKAEVGTSDFRRDLWKTVLVTVGSVLFAAFVNPVVSALFVNALGETAVPEGNVRALCAVALGAFAQPLAVWGKSTGLPSLLRRLKLFIDPEGERERQERERHKRGQVKQEPPRERMQRGSAGEPKRHEPPEPTQPSVTDVDVRLPPDTDFMSDDEVRRGPP